MVKTATSVPLALIKALETLQAELQRHDDALFEKMSAHLFSRLLGDIAVTVCKTGSQFGADAGTAGLGGRRLRIECKRYRDTTPLSPRSLAGEVTEAVAKDPLLEAWILMATKKVTETERNIALAVGEKFGVPVVVIDWTFPPAGTGICALAALCASWPDVVQQHMGNIAASAASALTPHIGASVNNLRTEIAFWNIGFVKLRDASVMRLERIWADQNESRATLNQDAAGGRVGVHLISRNEPLRQLSDWWLSAAQLKSPAIVKGQEGVGKTWVTLDWINRHKESLPIIVVVPASAFLNGFYLSQSGLRDLLMTNLRGLTNSSLTDEYWRARVNQLLRRPSTEGTAILLVVDGLNQQPHVRWSELTDAVQGESLAGKLRLLVTTRQHYFEDQLRRLETLAPKCTQVTVGPYDDGELDELLRLHGMSRAEMHPSLTKLAAVPRLFPLVYRLKDNIALRSETSVPRLLFEYGRDVLQHRQPNTWTDDNWVAWLIERAHNYRLRIEQTKTLVQTVTKKEVIDSLCSPELSPEDVARRLSDVVDGGLFEQVPGITVKFRLREHAAILGLGLALLDTLSEVQPESFDHVHAELEKWLEPVAAIDQVADVLRAALAVASVTQVPDGQAVADSLLVAWMKVQNPSQSYQQDLRVFGDVFPRSMLAVVEQAASSSYSGAQFFAIQSLRKLHPNRIGDWHVISARMEDWASWILLPRSEHAADPGHYAKHHQQQLVERIGSAEPGEKQVLGVRLKLAYQHGGDVASAIPSILQGHDLTLFASVLRQAAVHRAVQVDGYSQCWAGLAWLALAGASNEVKTRDCLRSIAEEVLKLRPEPGVHEKLGNRVAAALLCLTGDPAAELEANTLRTQLSDGRDYDKDYLANPGASFFTLERRHLDGVLTDATVPMSRRLDKLTPYLADPNVSAPSDLTAVLQNFLTEENFKGIDEGAQLTAEQHRFERSEPLAARFVPFAHANAGRRWLEALASRDGERKYWSARSARQLLLMAGRAECEAITGLRTRTKLESYERHANTECLQIELLHKPVGEQLALLLYAEDYYFTSELLAVTRTVTAEDLLCFIDTNSANAGKAAVIALQIMAAQSLICPDKLADKLVGYLTNEDVELRNIAFIALSTCAPDACGRKLLAINWRVDSADSIPAHYGSFAVATASQHLELADVLPLVAPWRWLDVAVVRGKRPSELRLASEQLLNLVKSHSTELQELNALVSMRAPDTGNMARISVSERPNPDDDGLEGLRRMAEPPDEIDKRTEEFAKEAAAGIQSIRSSGNLLFLHAFNRDSMRDAYLAAREVWDKMLEGAGTLDAEFVKRVRCAEGLYASLCEVLLETDPPNGVLLWRALRSCMLTQLKGRAGIAELDHVAFRAPDSAEVGALRNELASFASTGTDKQILDLVIVAQINGKDAWLQTLVDSDSASSHLWRRKRAIVLDGFRQNPTMENLTYPEGAKLDSWQALRARMQAWTNRGTFARHWWNLFLSAATADEAFSAWRVFLCCADRRAHIWMQTMLDKSQTGSELDRLRRLHVVLNLENLERNFRKQEESSPGLADKLFAHDAPARWLQLDDIQS